MNIVELNYPLSEFYSEKLEIFLKKAYSSRFIYKYPLRWKWLYNQPMAKSYFALENKNIIGHVGIMPFIAKINSSIVNGSWSIDTFVLEPFRNKGIGSKLQMLAQTSSDIFQSVWMSSANKNIKYKNGGRNVSNLFILYKSSNVIKFKKNDYIISKPVANLIQKKSIKFLQKYNYYILRSEKYCNWRYIQQPYSNYLQVNTEYGISLIKKNGYLNPQMGTITDVFVDNYDIRKIQMQLNCSAFELIKQGCSIVRYSTTDLEILKALQNDGWDILKTLPLIVYLKTKSIKIRNNIYLSLSDQDMDQFPW